MRTGMLTVLIASTGEAGAFGFGAPQMRPARFAAVP